MAPPGLNGNQSTLLVVVTICFLISTLSVILRVWSRRKTRSSLWWDDWAVIVAWFMSAATNVFIYVSIKTGLGRHISELTVDDLTTFGISFYLQELSWTLAMGFVVQSMLAFYIRLFPIKKWLRYSNYGLSVFNAGWTIATFLTLTFQCTPVQFFWNKTIPSGTCINAPLFYFINGTISMLTVFVVLLLPTPVLLGLQIPTSKKVGLVFTFTIGSFVCGMSVARLISIRRIDNTDLPWSAVFPGMWSCVETNIGVASACIPAFAPLIRLLFGKPAVATNNSGVFKTDAIYTQHSVLQSFDSKLYGRVEEGNSSYELDNRLLVQTSVQTGQGIDCTCEGSKLPRPQSAATKQPGW